MSRTRAAFSYHNRIKVVVTQLDSNLVSTVSRDTLSSALHNQAKAVVAAVEKAAAGFDFPVIRAETIVDYITAAAVIGDFMPIAWLYDDAQAVDQAVLNLFKSITDDAFVAETATLAVVKSLVDQGVITDLAQLSVARPASDQFSASDLISVEPTKGFFEGFSFADTHRFDTTKALFDALNITDDVDGEASILDDQEIQFFKHTSDAAAVSDSLVRQLNFVRFFSETPAVSEVLARSFSKSLSDTAVPADVLAKTYQAPKADSLILSDTFSRLVAFSRAFTEQPVLADALSKSLARAVADVSSATDTLTRAVVKQLNDAAVAQDTLTKGTTKTTADAVSADEIVLRNVGAVKTEPAVASDFYASSLARFLSDGVAFSDTFASSAQYSRSLLDAANATDDVDGLASILDDQEISFVKTNNNTLFVSESNVFGVEKFIGDAASLADAGSLRSQGYADFTYFAEDFVGASRTF